MAASKKSRAKKKSTTRKKRTQKRSRNQASPARLKQFFDPPQELERPDKIRFGHPRHPKVRATTRPYEGWEAYRPQPLKAPEGFQYIGGVPVRVTKKGPKVPQVKDLRERLVIEPWRVLDWKRWGELIPLPLVPCAAVPSKTARVEVPVLPLTRMMRVSGDCARVYALSHLGCGVVVNVVTETVEACFHVTPNPSPTPAYPAAIKRPIVHPFTKGGINHKYKRLYVPASFYAPGRNMSEAGFYVAVVDVDPTSSTYLDTVDWIDCGWIPEEVAFTPDGETGVIANYMQGTATVFRASDGAILTAQVDGFAGAGASTSGGPWARSVRCANVPGIGNRAFLTLSSSTPSPGLAVIDLDDPAHPRTNISLTGGALGVAATPDQRRVLALNNGQIRVIKVDQATPVVERTISLPSGGGQSYWGGIAVRPSGNLAFAATGSANSSSPTQGTTLAQVNYMNGTVLEIPTGLASQTWNVDIHSLGSPLKPHLFIGSLSGMVTIIPC